MTWINVAPDHVGYWREWAQQQVAAHHYLRKRVDPRSRPFVYTVHVQDRTYPVGCLIFGRPEATRCYDGNLTYGSQADVVSGRAQYDRWAVLNLARVWLDPCVQPGGACYRQDALPGYVDRRGVWRSTLASTAIRVALRLVSYDYLKAHPPVDCSQPYQIEVVLSYCDLSKHKGTIYRAAGFRLARRNERNIETWFTSAVTPMTEREDATIRRLADQSPRSLRIRARRSQLELAL